LVDFKKKSPLKLLSQMNWNLVGSIYGRSYIKIGHYYLKHVYPQCVKYNYKCVQHLSINHNNCMQA
jgi:hypothetical protein